MYEKMHEIFDERYFTLQVSGRLDSFKIISFTTLAFINFYCNIR